MRYRYIVGVILTTAACFIGSTLSWAKRPLIIGHRGSPGMLPEHTVEGYKLAVRQGTDVIECDVAITKDLKLLCTHESWLSATTDVVFRAEFQDRIRTYYVPRKQEFITDYFTIDFTLEELMSLTRVQVMPFRNQEYNYKFHMASFDEYVAVAKNETNPRMIYIYPETKNPDFFNIFLQKYNTNMETLLLDSLEKHGYTNPDSPCFIQSFSIKSLQYMSERTSLPLVFLSDSNLDDPFLKNISSFIDVVCPRKDVIVDVENRTNFVPKSTGFVQRAHKYGLKVHTFVFRNEYFFLAYDYGSDPYREYETFIDLGVEGMFTDFPWSLYNYLELSGK